MSEYWYRGAYQAESSVSFGADIEMGSMYIGTWGGVSDVEEQVRSELISMLVTTLN